MRLNGFVSRGEYVKAAPVRFKDPVYLRNCLGIALNMFKDLVAINKIKGVVCKRQGVGVRINGSNNIFTAYGFCIRIVFIS